MFEFTKPSVALLSSDLDGTLLGDHDASVRFKKTWEALLEKERPILVYNSGRGIEDMRSLIAAGLLPAPDYLIGGVGTELHDQRHNTPVPEFSARFGEGWDLDKINGIVGAVHGIEPQPPEFQHQHKSSWFWPNAASSQLDDLRTRLAAAGLRASVIYSSHLHLDVLPVEADKGNALVWLCARLTIPLRDVVVAGDSGNDRQMVLLPGVRRIVVSNAQPELFESIRSVPAFVTRKAMADGVLEGLRYFGVTPSARPSRAAADVSGG